MATLFVHIGTHKTGTTTLQRFFSDNRNDLAKYNLIYPVSWQPGGEAHHWLAAKLAGCRGGLDPNRLRLCVEEVGQQIGSALKEGKDVLLSSEVFARLSLTSCPNLPSRLANLVPKSTEFRIIVYLRRQDLFLKSFWAQQISWSSGWWPNLDLQYARRNYYLPYSKLLGRWEAVFGRDNIVVRPFEKESLVAGDLVDDFCRQIGLSEFKGRRAPDTQKLNAALTIKELQAIDYVWNALAGPAPVATDFARRFVKQFSDSLQLGGGPTAYLSPSLARKILQMSSAENKSIANAYLNRDRLFLNERVAEEAAPESLQLQGSELEQIDMLLEPELVHFNRDKALQNTKSRIRSSYPLRLRANIYRKQWKIGTHRISGGLIIRMGELFMTKAMTRVRQKLHG